MIKSVKIKNYQSHKDTYLQLDSGVNVIIGDNNAGKTGILRALGWLFFNRPSGGKIANKFSGKSVQVEVSADFEEGNNVKLSKLVKFKKNGDLSVSKAQYSLDGKSFKGFGSSVPDLVSDTINMSEINIQDQLDSPFLVASSPGEMARTINRITNLDVSDTYIKYAAKLIGSTNKEIDWLLDIVDNAEEYVKKYEGVEDIKNIIEEAENYDDECSKLENIAARLLELIDDLESAESAVEFGSVCDEAYNLAQEANDLQHEIQILLSISEEIDSFVTHFNYTSRISDIYSKIDGVISEISVLNSDIENLSIDSDNIEYYLESESIVEANSVNLDDVKSVLDKFIEDNNICPLCKGILDKSFVERIVGS